MYTRRKVENWRQNPAPPRMGIGVLTLIHLPRQYIDRFGIWVPETLCMIHFWAAHECVLTCIYVNWFARRRSLVSPYMRQPGHETRRDSYCCAVFGDGFFIPCLGFAHFWFQFIISHIIRHDFNIFSDGMPSRVEETKPLRTAPGNRCAVIPLHSITGCNTECKLSNSRQRSPRHSKNHVARRPHHGLLRLR